MIWDMHRNDAGNVVAMTRTGMKVTRAECVSCEWIVTVMVMGSEEKTQLRLPHWSRLSRQLTTMTAIMGDYDA